MSVEDIQNPVLSFIREHIESVEQLEILLLLYHRKDRSWTPEEIAKELRSSAHSARKRLGDFEAKGFVRKIETLSHSFQYNSHDSAIDAQIQALAEAYQVRRMTIIDIIFSKPLDKIQVFADAFKFREDK